MTGAELELLFSNFTFSEDLDTLAWIYFPESQRPDESEIRLLRNMITAMRWLPGQVRYSFLQSLNHHLEMNEPARVKLFFGFPEKGIQGPLVEESEGGVKLFFSTLHKIQANLELKNEVWRAMKPFAAG